MYAIIIEVILYPVLETQYISNSYVFGGISFVFTDRAIPFESKLQLAA